MTDPEYRNYVDGAFVDWADGYADDINPSTGEVIATIPQTSAEYVGEAVRAARAAQPAWAALPGAERAARLHALASALRSHRDTYVHILVVEQGKTRALAATEVDFTADYIDYMAEWGRRIEGDIIPSDRPGESILLGYRPLGVVAGILPWNFPFFLIARKAAPALITGNTIVLKPSSDTPLSSLAFAPLLEEAGIPAGVVNIVAGRGSVTGEALIDDPGVDLVTFTGSTAQGRHIAEVAGRHLTRVNLELGGKAPAIVLADADLDLAAHAIWQSRVINTGQVCNCAEKVFVERSAYTALVDKLGALFDATRVGDPDRVADLDMGPLINARALESVRAAVQGAVEGGATVLAGDQSGVPESGNFLRPVLLGDVREDQDIMRKETFGPVLPVEAVDSLDQAIALANDSRYGLTSSIFTRDLDSATRAARELEYGETYVNREHFEGMQGFHAGRKDSGIGGADGKHGVYEFLETHVTYLQTH